MWAQQLWCMGLLAPRHVLSSQARDRTRVPCVARQIPNHWETGEAPHLFLRRSAHVEVGGKSSRVIGQA